MPAARFLPASLVALLALVACAEAPPAPSAPPPAAAAAPTAAASPAPDVPEGLLDHFARRPLQTGAAPVVRTPPPPAEEPRLHPDAPTRSEWQAEEGRLLVACASRPLDACEDYIIHLETQPMACAFAPFGGVGCTDPFLDGETTRQRIKDAKLRTAAAHAKRCNAGIESHCAQVRPSLPRIYTPTADAPADLVAWYASVCAGPPSEEAASACANAKIHHNFKSGVDSPEAQAFRAREEEMRAILAARSA